MNRIHITTTCAAYLPTPGELIIGYPRETAVIHKERKDGYGGYSLQSVQPRRGQSTVKQLHFAMKMRYNSLIMKAVEITGTIDRNGRLSVQQKLDATSAGPVRVIVLFPDADDIREVDWLMCGKSSRGFDFLNDPIEDIYTPSDGKPFNVKV